MSNSNSTYDTYDTPRRPKITGFVVLTMTAMVVGGMAIYLGGAPFTSRYPEDWIGWARIQPTSAGAVALAGIVLLIGLLGLLAGLMSASSPRQRRSVYADTARSGAAMALSDDARLAPAAPANLEMAKSGDSRGNLNFETPALDNQPHQPLPAGSLELKVFSDNASDSFLSLDAPIAANVLSVPEPQAATAPAVFDSNAVLSDSHGLHIGSSTAQVVQLHPETAPATGDIAAHVAEALAVPVAAAAVAVATSQAPSPTLNIVEDMNHAPEIQAIATHEAALDPLGAALLADSHAVPSAPPPSDINSVINSAKSFMATPGTLIEKDPPVAAELAAAAEAMNHSSVPHPVDDDAEIRSAVQTALSVWPDQTRPLVSDELTRRIGNLYHDKAPDSAKAFHQIASGDLSAAAGTLQNQASIMAQVGLTAEAAEVWRAMGALHMGRDDPKALTAYEKVSELDPMDANIHLYLARRYQMSGETAKLPPVLGRALAVISDPATRMELLAPYADIKMKTGDAKTAGDAFDELSHLQAATAQPSDIAARSAYGISLARMAQAREVQGVNDVAGASYRKAHDVFAALSAQKPDHPGLKAMADSALRDAQRLNA